MTDLTGDKASASRSRASKHPFKRAWEGCKRKWEDFKRVREDYDRPAELIAYLLVLCCVLGAIGAWLDDGLLVRVAPDSIWLGPERMLVSDSFRMFLTLLFALFIAMSIKRRQEDGLLDGGKHYDIGRALAYGYFKNFLVGALILAKNKGRTLYVFKPESVKDLRAFETEVWPEANKKIQSRAVELDFSEHGRSTPLVRRIVVVGSTSGGGQEFWMDFPTALFTVGDYYESWNRKLMEDKRPPINKRQQGRLEKKQIDAFFEHLNVLITTDAGYKAVEEFQLTRRQLINMRDEYYKELSLQEFRDMLQNMEPPATSCASPSA